MKIPFEARYGHKSFVQNFKVFGCICFTYVPKVKRDKLDKKRQRLESSLAITQHQRLIESSNHNLVRF